MPMIRVDLNGRRYGRLLVLRDNGTNDRGRTEWVCACDCGVEVVVETRCLRGGNTQSCGCLARQLTSERHLRPIDQVILSKVVRDYRYSAKARKLEWALTREQTSALIFAVCHYCGNSGTPIRTTQGPRRETITNGIDRRDNLLGYTFANSVACCTDCNGGKSDKAEAEFIAWAQRIVNHQDVQRMRGFQDA